MMLRNPGVVVGPQPMNIDLVLLERVTYTRGQFLTRSVVHIIEALLLICSYASPWPPPLRTSDPCTIYVRIVFAQHTQYFLEVLLVEDNANVLKAWEIRGCPPHEWPKLLGISAQLCDNS
jgi:hypothetical protein